MCFNASPIIFDIKAAMDTGTRLKLVRERTKLSQRELARRSGLTNSTISQIEQNRVSPSVSSLKKLLEGIPMSLATFFVGSALLATEAAAACWAPASTVSTRRLPLLRAV